MSDVIIDAPLKKTILNKKTKYKVIPQDLLTIIKDYMKVDYDHDDEAISSMIKSAKSYLEDAGVEIDLLSQKVILTISLLVNHYYNERTIYGSHSVVNLPFSIMTLIMQMKADDNTVGGVKDDSKTDV
jgi:uncharacterized phage protein (predicted DNA packaging)